MFNHRRNRQAGRRRSGTSFVEFALVLPVLLGIVMGIIDFGWLERNTLVITNAAREGARAASLGQPTSTIKARIANGGAPLLKADASGNLTNGSITMEQAPPPSSGSTLAYTSWPPDSGSGTSQKNGVPAGDYVRITVSYAHRSITGLFSRTVSIPVIMRREA